MKTASGEWSRSQNAKKAGQRLIVWLSDTSRHHDVKEDERVLHALLSSPAIHWNEINAVGIPLLPPLPNSPRFGYDRDMIEYLTAYKNRPARPPTLEESWEMLSYVVGHTSYAKDVLPVLFDAGFTLRDSVVTLPDALCHTPPIGNALIYYHSLDTLKMMLDGGMLPDYVIINADTGFEFRYSMMKDARNRGREDVVTYLKEKYSM